MWSKSNSHLYHTGRGESASDVFDDTWALDMATQEWAYVNTTHSAETPEGRFDAAGGVWGNLLWLNMGRNKNGRTLSDTWILNISMSDENNDELIGEPDCMYSLFIHTLRHIHMNP